MNMFARFDENPAMTLQDIKEIKRLRRTHTRIDGRENSIPPQTKFVGGITYVVCFSRPQKCFEASLPNRGDPDQTAPFGAA